ncbi:uncharacterized protein LOC124935972 isoform X2 [Impatiens glandulifera]|uniref:uncharacterized protein LOC124935972 isoform X2 n=1 Tax=Impatiens glandulifera TaxID=253017 RepID=UPI001FB0D5AA|nr:uncharacterized protein LOC124935972 isoform X2 [Impatiens glandulifera]
MTGNEVGYRAHNFFAQDATPGLQPSHSVDGSWTMLGNNMWPESQRHGVPIPNSKNYSVGQSDNSRGTGSHTLPEAHGLNFTQSNFRPELVSRNSPSQNSNVNSYMHGYPGYQTNRNETNFLGVDSETDGHNMNSRGSSFYELQQGPAPGHNLSLDSSEPSDSPVSFDFMGGQQQMSGHNTGTLQPFSRQNTLSDMHLLQQEVMFRKMQELQRQQQIQQVEARQHQIQQVEARQQQIQHVEARQQLMSQIPFGGRQASGNHSPAISNGNPISQVNEVLNHHWSGELASANGSWMHRDAATIQGSPSGHKFSPEQGQALNFMGLVPSHVDESLYGVPISSTRIDSNQDSQTSLNKSSTHKMMTSSNHFHSNKFSGFQVENSNRDENSIYRHDDREENIFSHAPRRSVENVNQVGILQRNAFLSNAHERHELADPAKTLQEKMVLQSTSHTPAGLDPDEERILYGDGNIWDALGDGPSAGAEGSSLLHGTGFSNALPSLQSGSWSALMQSAVAETSSSDVGFREETNGPHFPYSEIQDGNNQIYEANAKQESILGENKSNMSSTMHSRSGSLYDGVNLNNNCGVATGSQQSGSRMSYQQGNKLQDSFNKSFKHSHEERNESLNGVSLQKAVAEESQVYGNAAHSGVSEMGVKNTSMPCALPDSYIGMGQPSCKPNGRDLNESGPLNGDLVQVHGNASSLKLPESNDQTRSRYQEMGHPGGLWRPNAISNSHGRLASSSLAGGGNPKLSNIAGMSNPDNLQVSQDINQTLPHTDNFAYWKQADSSMRKNVNEGQVKSNSGPNESPQVLESYNSNKAGIKVHEKENDGDENSFEGNQSNKSHHTFSGGLNDIARSDVDSRAFSGANQKMSGSAGRKPPVRRFQYHPMGNLNDEMDPSHGGGHANHPHIASEQISQGLLGQNQGHRGQSRVSGQVTKNNFETDKGYLPTDSQGKRKREEKGTYPGSSLKSSALSVPTSSTSSQNKGLQSSQHMLELIQKVDQPKDNNLLHLRSSQIKSSSTPEDEISDGSEGQIQQNRSFASRGFGLQLGPPSQGQLQPNELAPPQDPRKMVSSLSATRITQEGYGLKQTGGLLNQIIPGINMRATAATTSLDGHSLQFKRIDESSSGVHTDASSSASFSHNAGMISPDNALSLADASQLTRTRHSHEQFVSQGSGGNILPSIGSVVASNQSKHTGFPKLVPNEWVNVPRPNASRVFQPGTLSGDATPTSSSSQHMEEKDAEKAGRGSSNVNSPGLVQEETQVRERVVDQRAGSVDSDLTGKVTATQVKEVGAFMHSSSNQRDIEAFGRTLISQNYSLLHQVKAMKNPEMNLCDGDLNRLKMPDNALIPQKIAQFSESRPMDKGERNVPSQAELGLDSRIPNHYYQISPQMAPSWFNKFGTMNNGQVLPAHDDARNASTLKTTDQAITLGMSYSIHSPLLSKQVDAMAEPSQVVNILGSSTSNSLPTESSLQMLPQGIIDTPLPVVRQKKRKTATSELLPWHKELSQGPQNIPSISIAEEKWAKAANRLIDKVDEDAENEDVRGTKRLKRRLILTTQLMQQLFYPPSSVHLSADASSSYHSVCYSAARLTLGDACSLSCLGSDDDATLANESILLDKHKNLRGRNREHLSTDIEVFLNRAQKLEIEFTRLDKRVSVLDSRLECQDLEKFSVINRFAKFHNRGQSSDGGADGSNSQQRLYPQRYVTALPMPSNVPDMVQCLSL